MYDTKAFLEDKTCLRKSRAELREQERQKSQTLTRIYNYQAKRREKMSEEKKEYAQGIYIKKFEGKYGEWLSVSIKKPDGTYDNFKFYPKKEQKNDKYIEFYGVVDDWKPEKKEEKTEENIVKFGEEEIPF